MTIRVTGSSFRDNGGHGMNVNGKAVQLDASDNIFKGNKKSGVNLRVGNESEVSLANNQFEGNLEGGLTIEEYNENFHLIEQFINANLKKATQEEADKLTTLLDKAKSEEQIEAKKSLVSEIYDIVKNGLIISSMSVGVEKAFDAILGLAG
ncbi:right-handed parallel beta-helix repeat-containing protein [Priestia megaterium]|uniref:right-handed parallel beta-helix repeat-containing protein n=1 Tax=Priestia megaterium TaxID=1404 RepID=UPI0005C4B2C4|nr:right-handed parallel beta-helix repeat-containing protein [Priestia megaterium]